MDTIPEYMEMAENEKTIREYLEEIKNDKSVLFQYNKDYQYFNVKFNKKKNLNINLIDSWHQYEEFSINQPLVVIEGNNGSGKTTILEALHYTCFFKSFRSNRAKDLIAFDHKHFFSQVNFEESSGALNQIQVGLSHEDGETQKRLVRFNKKLIKSYRDIISHYRIISLVESDMQLVQGAPEERRYFLNQLLVLFDADFFVCLRKYKQILEHRNSILMNVKSDTKSNDGANDGAIDRVLSSIPPVP